MTPPMCSPPPRAATAILIAAHARSASGCSPVAAPSSRRENRSITVARYSLPAAVGISVMSPDPAAVRRTGGEVPAEQVGELRGGLVLPGQPVAAPDPAGDQALAAHRVRDRLLHTCPAGVAPIGVQPRRA